jgi:hypothetical protein
MNNYEYGEVIEVSNDIFSHLMTVLSGYIAGRQEGNKSYIQIWMEKSYCNKILKLKGI